MKAMVLNELGEVKSNSNPLSVEQILEPSPGEGEVLIKVLACGVCHTELDEIEGRTPPPELPVVLGHQVVGVVEEVGKRQRKDFNRSKTAASALSIGAGTAVNVGDRVGVAWIYAAIYDRPGGVCTPHSRGADRFGGCTSTLRRSNWVPFAAAGEHS